MKKFAKRTRSKWDPSLHVNKSDCDNEEVFKYLIGALDKVRKGMEDYFKKKQNKDHTNKPPKHEEYTWNQMP